MVFHNQHYYFYRSGPQDRRQLHRFFYVKRTGWFVHLRGDQELCDGIEVNSGIAGPFESQTQAKRYLARIIQQSRAEAGRTHGRVS